MHCNKIHLTLLVFLTVVMGILPLLCLCLPLCYAYVTYHNLYILLLCLHLGVALLVYYIFYLLRVTTKEVATAQAQFDGFHRTLADAALDLSWHGSSSSPHTKKRRKSLSKTPELDTQTYSL